METLIVIGRIVFGGYFIMMGMNHVFKTNSLTGYAQSKGVPSPWLAVFVTGLMLLAGGLGVVFRYQINQFNIALWLIVIFLLFTSFKMHAFWKETDSQAKMGEMTNFMKNMALLGASLAMMSL